MNALSELAVIIPVARGETAWVRLLTDLRKLPSQTEIIFVCPDPVEAFVSEISLKSIYDDFAASRYFSTGPTVGWITSRSGRAAQQNLGASGTNKRFLWFLHADTRFSDEAILALSRSLERQIQDSEAQGPERRGLQTNSNEKLVYFNLKFQSDGPKSMWLNRIGVWWRSHLFSMPFGDQGFCISKKSFVTLGGFSETASFGEDHLFVWAARREGLAIQCVGAPLLTSARRYREQGWIKTTLKTLFLTFLQAVPQLFKLIKIRAHSFRVRWQLK